MRALRTWIARRLTVVPLILSLLVALGGSGLWISGSFAQASPGFIRVAHRWEADETGLQHPRALAFSVTAKVFRVVDGMAAGQPAPDGADIATLNRFGRRDGSAHIAAHIGDPVNVAFDDKFHRLLIFQTPEARLLAVSEDASGQLDPAAFTAYSARSFGAANPQGVAVDAENGALFILDADGPRILCIQPEINGDFAGATISEISLQQSGIAAPHGLALDATTGHVYVSDPTQHKLYEITQSGQKVATRDLAPFELSSPEGMVIAPSGDQTDSPSSMSLYIADSGGGTGKSEDPGQIVEFALGEPAIVSAMTTTYTSTLIRTTNMAALTPPSPDPDGIAYLPLSNSLMISDSEVEETVSGTTHFAGADVWETTLTGSIIRTANISPVPPTLVPMTDEPTGVAWSPVTGHFFFSDDNAFRVWDLNPGGDGLVGTADDTWTSFSTQTAGSGDPEGITYDTWHDRLFEVDGNNAEVYQFTLTGSLVAHFDVASLGVVDPEGVEFNRDTGTLYVLSNAGNPIVVETTLSGTLLQTINVSADNALAPAGLAYAPASDGSGAMHFYIVDRGIDNNNNSKIVDGKMYEMSAPASGTPVPTDTQGPSSTPTITPTQTNTPTATNTRTPTPTGTSTPTRTPSRTPTPTGTATQTQTPTYTPTQTSTPTQTNTPTETGTATPSRTPTATSTSTPSQTATATATSTASRTATFTPTSTATASYTPTSTKTPTNTPSQTPTQTRTATATATYTPTSTVTNTPTASATATDTSTPTSTATNTATSTATRTPLPTNVHIGDLDGTSAWVGNKWTARVTIAVHDSNERLLANAKVTGVWSGGASSTANCTTNSAGRCTVTSPQMGSAKTSITFSVRSVQYGKLTYKPIANHDPDGDSTGKAITVRPPLLISRASSGGSILESAEISGRGAEISPTASTFNLGDDELNKQYRAILSFNTGSLPDNAVITRATLTLTSQSITGSGNPFSLLQGLIVDVRKGYFGPASTLEASDFQAVASLRGTGPYSPTPVLGVYTITLSSTSLGYINKLNSNAGLTQLRLRYKLDDNDDHSANFITFYSGYSLAAYRPRLTITYYVP